MRQKFLNFITLKGFSKATIRTYLSLFDIIISDDDVLNIPSPIKSIKL